jgi:cytidylate kinase
VSDPPLPVQPLVIVSGWTASGKTTLVDNLGLLGLERITASTLLVHQLGGGDTSKTERLLSWLSPVQPNPRDGETDRLTDLAVLRRTATRLTGCVVESAGSVPLLLSPYNDAFLVRLEASPRVRAKRLTRLFRGRIKDGDSAQIIERKDCATSQACQRAWGLDLAAPPHRRRYDLIIGCPDDHDCADSELCRTATLQLVDAAYHAYLGLLTADHVNVAEGASRLGLVTGQFWPWVRRLRPALIDLGAPRPWADRLTCDASDFDVPRMGASC